MSKDLKDVLEKIEEDESVEAKLQARIERLTELVDRQKKIINEQEQIIEAQKKTQVEALEVPEDVRELKEIIGMQRGLLNERELELEHAKASQAQAQKELELYKEQRESFDKKFTDALQQVGALKATLAEKESELIVKTERINLLENKIQETRAFEGKYKEEYSKEIDQVSKDHSQELDTIRNSHREEIGSIRNEYRNEIEQINRKYAEENQELQSKLTKLETILLQSEFMSGDKELETVNFEDKFKDIYDKQKELMSKIEQLNKEKAEAMFEVSTKEDEMKEMKKNMEAKLEEVEEQAQSIVEYSRLKPLMEQEGIFKAYFIIKDVGQISIDDLRSAVGSPIVLVRKMVEQLKKIELIEENEAGKIMPTKFQ